MTEKPRQCGEAFRVAVGNKSQRCGYTAFLYAVFECVCGKKFPQQVRHIQNGNTVSCGCHKSRITSERRTTHGQSKTREYKIWKDIVKRCCNRNHHAYHHYGGRGITITESWRRDFLVFLSAVGPSPSENHSIDRIDNNRGYEPGNVRWATKKEQSRNTRSNRLVDYRGEVMSLAEACERSGVSYSAAKWRLRNGAGFDEVAEKPAKKRVVSKSVPTLPVSDGPYRALCEALMGQD